MNTFPVSQERAEQLAQRMASVGIRESDIDETFVRSGGHGGQHVNKTSTCVMLLHRPSGIQVKCQSTRQQGMNRFLARQILAQKIETLRRNRADAKRAIEEKIRRRNRPRGQGAKRRILADKALHSAKKQLRRSISRDM